MRKSFLTALFLFLILPLFSQELSFEENKARTFFELNYPNSSLITDGPGIDTSFTYKNLTIVNFNEPQGFVIIRAEQDGIEIMGYSYTNHFLFEADTTGAIEKWADVLTMYTDVPGYSPDVTISRLKTGRLPVEPLVQTAWNQGWPYNYYCPMDNTEDRRAIVGCVAVAVGQIIRYYDKWNDFAIQHSYVHDTYGTLSCNAGAYNWNSMENSCLGINHEVARLLYHSGVLVNMGYGVSSSGASSGKAASLFSTIYEGGYLNNDPYGNEEMFYSSISKYKPIYSTYEGHAFVCDGFDGNSYYHFNLGWGGSANGFYLLANVLGKPLLSAIFDTAPPDNLSPPTSFRKNILSDSEVEISWNGPEGDRTGLTGYSIYLDDIFLEETSDTVHLHYCHPGSHYLRVTANYSTGESRWIGPGSYFSHGEAVPVQDEKLRIAINTSAGVSVTQRSTHSPSRGELYGIRHLNVTNADDLSGISNCINLQQLILNSSSTEREIDLSEVGQCQKITLLRITNYKLVGKEGVSELTGMQELKLHNNSLENLDFLSGMKDLYKIDIEGNPLSDIGFLNPLARLTWIRLNGCGIDSFDQLENTYGVEFLDVSDNNISDISWISGNRTLRSLNASKNQIEGELMLNGMFLLKSIDLSQNHLAGLQVTESPMVNTIYLADNLIDDFTGLLEENKALKDMNLSGNQVKTIPEISNILDKLDLGNNMIYDLVPILKYSALTDLNLGNNRITDVSPLLHKGYAEKLEKLNLRDNPVSRESYMEYRLQLSQSAGAVSFPSRYNPASPCYLQPTADSVLMNPSAELKWEGDYDEQGYVFDVFLSKDDGEYFKIAESLESRSFETALDGSGNYSWFVLARHENDSLYSGYSKFKVFSGFNVPFFEDFEIYTPNMRLCMQSPYWRVNGEEQPEYQDAFVVNIRAYEGNNSIKVAGGTDLVFPVSEYLTGYCEADFMMMVDNNRQATVKTILKDGSEVSFYFYSVGICEVYHGQDRERFFSYLLRNWMQMEIISDPSRGLKWVIDSQEMFSIEDPQSIESIRFCTLDGPGYYESAPTVFYLDNFGIDKGVLLNMPDLLLDSKFPGNIFYNGEEIVVEDPPSGLKLVQLFNLQGQLLKTINIKDPNAKALHFALPADEKLFIAVFYDDRNRRYSRKIITAGLR